MDRAAQGHHRAPAPGVSKCVPRYGRDDVEFQLRCQRALLRSLDEGWVLKIPLDRGVHELVLQDMGPQASAVGVQRCPDSASSLPDVVCAPSDSHRASARSGDAMETESDSDESSFSSDAESSASVDSLSEETPEPVAGPWLLNIRSGVFHKSLCSKGGLLVLAYRPQSEVHGGFELREVNSLFQGFSACRHSGCFSK